MPVFKVFIYLLYYCFMLLPKHSLTVRPKLRETVKLIQAFTKTPLCGLVCVLRCMRARLCVHGLATLTCPRCAAGRRPAPYRSPWRRTSSWPSPPASSRRSRTRPSPADTHEERLEEDRPACSVIPVAPPQCSHPPMETRAQTAS